MRHGSFFFAAPQRLFRLRGTLARGLGLRLQGRQPFAQLCLRIAHKADLAFQARHLACSGVVVPLQPMDRIPGLVVRSAGLLKLGFDCTLRGQRPVDFGLQHLRLTADARLLGLRLIPAHQPEHALLELPVTLQRAELAGHLSLALELIDLCLQLAHDVIHAREVFASVGQAMLGLATPLLIFSDARSLFQEHPQVLGARLDDARHRALADHGVGARPQPGTEEHVVHILAAHDLVVDQIGGLPVTREHPLD